MKMQTIALRVVDLVVDVCKVHFDIPEKCAKIGKH